MNKAQSVINPIGPHTHASCYTHRCLDISNSRCKLALVDEANNVAVYDLNTKVSTCAAAGMEHLL